ncbi:hypothetical protein ACO0LL_25690 [Undibacterium sp. TC4M20W]|uniref:hypothetical protein n=1 Tax=Undibacterium sp. TC4M20W TaxID=3413052 RepID=UPI003BF43E37
MDILNNNNGNSKKSFTQFVLLVVSMACLAWSLYYFFEFSPSSDRPFRLTAFILLWLKEIIVLVLGLLVLVFWLVDRAVKFIRLSKDGHTSLAKRSHEN